MTRRIYIALFGVEESKIKKEKSYFYYNKESYVFSNKSIIQIYCSLPRRWKSKLTTSSPPLLSLIQPINSKSKKQACYPNPFICRFLFKTQYKPHHPPSTVAPNVLNCCITWANWWERKVSFEHDIKYWPIAMCIGNIVLDFEVPDIILIL